MPMKYFEPRVGCVYARSPQLVFDCSCGKSRLCCAYYIRVKKQWPKSCSGYHCEQNIRCPNKR